MYADHREDVDEILAGDIGAVLGLKHTFTGHTLTDMNEQVVWKVFPFPTPLSLLRLSRKPQLIKTKWPWRLKLSEEDPTFQVRQTRRLPKPLFLEWVNFTWKSLWTECFGSSTCMPMLDDRE